MRRAAACAAVGVLLFATTARGETVKPARTREFVAQVERSLPGWLDRYLVPRADVAVIEDHQVVWSRSFGDSPGEVFQVASLTKTATALAVLRLVEDGKVDLDRPVNDYLERWKLESSEFDASRVTTRSLLDHTSGLPLGYPTERTSSYPDIVEVLDGNTSVPTAELTKEPGTAFTYSNPGYGVIELLIEDVTGRDYPDVMRDLVFKPLGMSDTGFQDDDELVKRTITGYRRAGRSEPPHIRFARAAGGMLSTAPDIGRLLIGVSRPKSDGGLLAERSLTEMRRLEDASKGAFGLSGGGYALGIATAPLPSGASFIGNNGSHESYNTLILSVPERDAGFVVLTNSATGFGVEGELAIAFFDEVIGERPSFLRNLTLATTGLRWTTVLALLLSLAFLVRVAAGVRRDVRAWPGEIRVRKLVLKSLPLGALGLGVFAVMDTGLLTGMLGGIEPARFVSDEYRWVVAGLSVCLLAMAVVATAVPKRKPGSGRRHEPEAQLSRST